MISCHNKVRNSLSLSYHLKTEGQSEINRSLDLIVLLCMKTTKEVANLVHWAEYWYKAMLHSTSQKIPFQSVMCEATTEDCTVDKRVKLWWAMGEGLKAMDEFYTYCTLI